MTKLAVLILVLLLAGIVYIFWTWDGSPPSITWEQAPEQVGKESRISLDISDPGKGLSSIEVALVQSGTRTVLLTEDYPFTWPWEAGEVHQRSIALSPAATFGNVTVTPGQFQLEVRAADQAGWGFWNHENTDQRTFEYDITPPRIEVLSRLHYIRQGGSEAVLYRVSDDAVSSGIQVGDQVFRGHPLKERPGEHIGLFALRHDQPADSSISLWAEDLAGNRAQTGFWHKIFPVRFRRRDIQVTDSFIQQTAPEIISHSPQISDQGSPLQNFLAVNDNLRQVNNAQIAEISLSSADQLLWQGPFLQLSNSQVESAFADHRTYVYDNQVVDRQTHLGFDLATVSQGPIECSNDGMVVFADYLGIYGYTVIVDHGLGLMSLYGHMSSMEVQQGDRVSRGQVLGRTGHTGLAGGDHLHYSMILQGVQVNPIEWWDAKWVDEHVLSKVRGGTATEATN
ncbi:MAG: M23 family metallopeptidase [Acidobacteriota bacterium]